MKFKNVIQNILWKRLLLGIVLGFIGGYLYYYFIGCQSGTCAIQSKPINMTLYGGLIGGILLFKVKKEED